MKDKQTSKDKQIALALFSGLGAMLAIGGLGYAQQLVTEGSALAFGKFNSSEIMLLMAAFGASAVLVFGVPESPLAQPRNVIFGHLLTASIGLIFVHLELVNTATLALATGFAVSGMLLTKTTHPPAGANPLFIMLTGQSWSFLVTPVLLGALTIVLLGKLMLLIRQRWLMS